MDLLFIIANCVAQIGKFIRSHLGLETLCFVYGRHIHIRQTVKFGVCQVGKLASTQALPGMACDRSRTPWRTPLSKECDKSHALPFQTRIKILYFSVTISQSRSTKSKILNDLIVIIKLFTKDNPEGCNIT